MKENFSRLRHFGVSQETKLKHPQFPLSEMCSCCKIAFSCFLYPQCFSDIWQYWPEPLLTKNVMPYTTDSNIYQRGCYISLSVIWSQVLKILSKTVSFEWVSFGTGAYLLHLMTFTKISSLLFTSDDSRYRKYWYIVFDIDISYRLKNIQFFDILRYFTPNVCILLLHYQKRQ